MSAAAVMAVVLVLFFLVGVAVGVLVVIAVSARRAHNAVPQVPPPPQTWPYKSGPGPDEGGPDEPGWWQARSGD
jgi:hypothetical protein